MSASSLTCPVLIVFLYSFLSLPLPFSNVLPLRVNLLSILLLLFYFCWPNALNIILFLVMMTVEATNKKGNKPNEVEHGLQTCRHSSLPLFEITSYWVLLVSLLSYTMYRFFKASQGEPELYNYIGKPVHDKREVCDWFPEWSEFCTRV